MGQESTSGRGAPWAVTLAVVLVPLVVLVLLAWAWSAHEDLEAGYLTRDVVSVLGGRWYAGALSTLGLFLWSAAATAAFLAGTLARSRGDEAARLLLWGGGLSVLLGLDDAFLFHEHVAPVSLGIPQRFVYLVYLVLVIAWLVSTRDALRRTEWQLLAAAGLLFAVSFAVDAAESVYESMLERRATFFAEDGTKLLGIAAWTAFFVRTAYASLSTPTRRNP
jgi:hypothetical protein